MGKWAFIRELSLPRFTAKHLADATDDEKTKVTMLWADATDADLAERVCDLKRHKAELEAALRETNVETELLSQFLINRWLLIDKEKEVYGFGTLAIKDEPYPQVVDDASAFRWLRKHKLGDLIHETVSWRALQSAIKELAADGAPLPDEVKDGIKVYLKQSLSVRDARGKAKGDEAE